MDLFTTTTQFFVLLLIGSTFAAMAALSILDSIADRRALAARFNSVTQRMPRVIAH